MLVQTYFPQHIAPKRYDAYLASGWFRGANMLYKTDLLCLDQDIFSVVNIRLGVRPYKMKKRHRQLLEKNNKRFTYEINPLKLDSQRESLYRKQKKRFKGFVHESLVGYLYGGEPQYVFNSFEVAVYDDDKLIAWSCFDLGEKSLASLIGLHDPDYKKYSLGIYTMLIELQFAKQHDYKWYYPGYVLDEVSSFDYKLSLGDLQFYNSNKRWVAYNERERSSSEARYIKFKTQQLLDACKQLGMDMDVEINPYFTMAYLNQYAGELEGYPLYIKRDLPDDNRALHLSYDTNNGVYQLNLVEPVYDLGIVSDPHSTNEYEEYRIYSTFPWQVTKYIGSSSDMTEIIALVVEHLSTPAQQSLYIN